MIRAQWLGWLVGGRMELATEEKGREGILDQNATNLH